MEEWSLLDWFTRMLGIIFLFAESAIPGAGRWNITMLMEEKALLQMMQILK